ncbi:Zinc-binding dehydrogenase [Ceratobasidium sp. AG-Ba]|nr:Zinc-binding dehydrogenase [Ceratobasidium sp. AG-Ba]
MAISGRPEDWNGHKSLELREVKITPPQKDEVLVKLHAASFNYRVRIPHGNIPWPYSTGPDGQGLILGCDGAGEIVAVGEGVDEWKQGDRVHSLFFEDWQTGPIKTKYVGTLPRCTGARSFSPVPDFRADTILSIPKHLTFEEAATIPFLVLGSGGVSVRGTIRKAAGARVIATTSSKEKEQKYRALGVDEIINYRETPNWSDKVRELTGGEGVDHVLEVGGQGTLVHSVKSVKREGMVHVIGAVAGGVKPNESISDLANLLLYGQVTMSGIFVGSKEMAQRLDAFIEKHRVKPLVDRVFGWTEAIEALDYQLKGSHFGKIVIKID